MSFSINGRSHQEVVGGTDALYQPGTTLLVVADPDDPSNVSTSDSVAHKRWSWTAYVPAAVSCTVLIAFAAVVGWRARRSKRTA